jgi:hypothetical protein
MKIEDYLADHHYDAQRSTLDDVLAHLGYDEQVIEGTFRNLISCAITEYVFESGQHPPHNSDEFVLEEFASVAAIPIGKILTNILAEKRQAIIDVARVADIALLINNILIL